MFLQVLIIFITFAIIGWVIELLYRSIMLKKFVNPGFMSGCTVPLYGFGALILYFINSLTNNIYILIFLSIFLLTILELITGIFLKKIFKLRLWNYSNRKFNYKGYICIRFSMYWLLFSLMFKYLVYPWIDSYCMFIIKDRLLMFILGIVYGIFIIDLCVSINLTRNVKKYALSISKVIDLEALRIDIRKKLTKNKLLNALYPYFYTNIFVKDNIKDKHDI